MASREISVKEVKALQPVDSMDVKAFYLGKDASDKKLEDDVRVHTFRRRALVQLVPPGTLDPNALDEEDYDVAVIVQCYAPKGQGPFSAPECLLLIQHFYSIDRATQAIETYYGDDIVNKAKTPERAPARKEKRRMLEMLGSAARAPDAYTLSTEAVVGKVGVLVATDIMQYIRLDCTAGPASNIFYNLRLTGFERSATDVMKDVWTKKMKLGDVKISRTADWVRAD